MKKADYYKKQVSQYVEDVLTGRRPANKYEKLAIRRYLDDLNKDWQYRFDEVKAARACSFFGLLIQYKGEFAGSVFKLEPWQVFIVWNIFGWVNASGYRRFTYADVVVPRKNGKTTLAAGIVLYMLLLDGEMGAECYAGAMDKEQARLCWDSVYHIAQKSDGIRDLLKFYRQSIVQEDTAGYFKPLSRDTKNKDGLNPFCTICDERHAWKNNELFEVIKSGMGARRQPLVFSITTAGTDTSAPYFADLRVLKDILDGTKEQENQFAIIYTIDDEDDWADERSWLKANPNLGVSLSMDYMRNEFRDARNKGGRTEANFKTKNLNVWMDAPAVWIQDEKVAACNLGTDQDSLQGEVCYAGFDFASHVDIVAMALYFPDLSPVVMKMFYWIPEEKVRQAGDRVDYRTWAEQGRIITTPGDMIDIDYIVSDIERILREYDVQCIAFDPYKMYHGIIQNLTKNGHSEVLYEFPQNIRNMSEPTKELERMVRAGEVDLLGDPVLRWMFKNVVIYVDPNGNVKLDKGKSANKIDGVVACVDAIGGYRALTMSEQSRKIYVDHELRTVRL